MKHKSIPILNLVVMLSMLLGAVATPAAAAAPATSSGSNLAAQQTDLSGPVQVEEQLRSQMMADGATGYLIYFRAEPDLSPALKMTWEERGKWTVKMLQETAKESQVRVIEYLDKQKAEYKAYWIDNVIVVNASNRNTFTGLQSFGEIEILRARRHPNFYEPVEMSDVMANLPQTVQSNLTHVGADQVWAQGITGQGIVVANIDTGVNYTHEALVQQYRGNLGGGVFNHDHNWYDPASGGTHLLVPADWHDHGSHTMGTMLGSTDPANPATAATTIGMAPGAKWIACRAFEATDQELLDCGQFMAAPTETDGVTDPDPNLRPNIINNSWGDCTTTYDPWFDGILNSWHALGIYPVFSNGNASNCGYSTPPGLNTVGSPARAGNVTGVGATGRNNGQYATFSNWGPTDQNDTINPMGYPRLKPQVVAPGTNYSAYNTGNDYGDMSGTSMSSPHVVGLVALMWSAASCLVGDYATTETIIQQTAIPIPYDSGGTPAPGPGNVPNYATGWGEINAPAAVAAAQGSCGPQGVLEGRVVKQSNPSEGIAGATIEASASPTQTYTIVAGPDGSFSKVVFTGVYTVTASAYAYLPETVTGVSVTEDMTTTMSDIALEAAPSYVVSGVVKDARTGWPLYAKIVVEGAPIPPVWSDPLTGAYTVNLLGGSVFALKATNFWGGYLESNVPVGPLTGDLTQDILLEPDMLACNAPGYLMHGINQGFDLTTIPAGWTITHVSGACDWTFNDPGSRGNLTGGTGNFAVADSDECGSGTTMNTILTSPKVDLSTLSQIMLSFKYDYNNLTATEVARVEVSANGGGAWTTVVNWGATDMRGPATFTQDVTALLSGATEAQVRFTYVAPGWDWWWEIDDVFLGLNDCAPQPGGLVVGSVADLNNGLPLLGATVEDGLASTQTVSTPLDPAVPDAFYTLFSPAGLKTITASMPQYADGAADVTVPLSGTVGQDFTLGAGIISYAPANMEVTLAGGATTTLPLTITNSGTYTASISLEEIDMGSLPFGVDAVDLPWVSESPATFDVGPGEDVVVDVIFDANIAPGIYNGEIKFNTGTPYPVANMPIKLTVQVPPTWGKVTGTVSTQGACDVNPAVLANVPVKITSEVAPYNVWNLTTDSQGMYYQWIDQAEGPVTIEVTVPGYLPGLYTGVPIVAGQSIAKDFVLRQLSPCFSVTPPSLEVTLGLGQNTTRQVKATNSGAATGVFTTTESGGSFTPAAIPTGFTGGVNAFSLAGPQVETATGPYFPMGDVNLILDDGTQENGIGLTDGGEFIWLNRFTPAAGEFPFTLNTVSLIFDTYTPNGSAMQLVIYEDTDGDPVNGATFLYSENVTVLNNDGSTWNVYNLTTPVQLEGPGDVFIGVVNRGATAAGQYPATIDQSSTLQRRSWVGLYSGAVPNPPTLPADDTWSIIDDLASTLAGNWMIRGAGSTGGGVPVSLDWLSETPTTSAVLTETFQWIDIGFDASKVALPGTYKGIVNFNTDDSENPVIPVNVTMHVQASALWGQLEGNVEATGRCDLDQEALAGADLTIVGTDGITRTVTADGDGYYLIWLPSSASPFTVTASKNGYFPDSESGIVVNSGGALTTAPLLVMRQDVPCVDYNPAGISITLPWGATGSETLNLTNTGPASSMFTITEQAGSFTPLASPAVILNESFDGTTFPPVGWTTYNKDTSSTQWVRSTSSPHSGLGKAFHTYGYGSPQEDGWLVTPPIELGLNSTLTFWENGSFPTYYVKHSVWICASSCANPPANYIQLKETGSLSAWRQQIIDLNAYNGQTVQIAFRYEGYDADTWSIDDVQVTSAADIVKWLSETPETGILPANTGNVPITLGFNAGAVSVTQPGIYTAFLKVANQDAGNTPLTVPVTMTVLSSATMGKLSGIVSGLLYCDGGPGVPLNLATVEIVGGVGGSITLNTDANGYFQRWLEAGAYTVNVSAANYLAQTIASVTVTGGMTTTQDVNLRWLKPCVNAAPTVLTATVNLGASATLPFTLTNTGPVATPFKITEVEGGFNPVAVQAVGKVLIVNDGSTTSVTAMKTALTTLGYTFDEVTNTVYTGMTIGALLEYRAVLYAGTISSGSEQTLTIAYLDAGGKLLLADNDQGYSSYSSVFYQTYLQATYGTDAGSDGPITGADIMLGIDIDISSDPYPDNFTISGANAVGIFANTSPRTGWAGLRIARNNYKAIYLAWDFYYTGGTADTATKLVVMNEAMSWLLPVDVPWLSASPIMGTLAADTGQQVVNVTMNAPDVPGFYYASLKVKTSDPVNPYRTINVSMNVPVDPGMGKLKGVVYDLGACDINPVPLANAYVKLTDGIYNWTTTTDANGYYQFWVGTTDMLVLSAFFADHQPDLAVVSVPEDGTVTHDLNLRWLKPCITAEPDSLTAYLTYPLSTTKVLSLTNSDLVTGTYTITPYTSGFIPVAVQGSPSFIQTYASGKSPTSKPTMMAVYPTALRPATLSATLINDGSFEGTAWTEVDNTGCTPWIGDWTSILGFGAYDGSQYFWAGGYCGAPNSNSAAQNITLPANAQNLTFWYQAKRTDADGATNGVAYVKVNGVTIWSLSMVQANNTVAWVQASADISAYAGQTVELKFGADNVGTGIGNVTFDYIEVTEGGGGGGSGNWLGVSPDAGNIGAAQTVTVDVIFDSSEVAQPGTYTGYLLVETDTPVYSSITVPVTMTVEIPAGWGKLEGVVQDLGYCDENPAPLEDATIFIEGTGGFTVTVMTAADGSYQYWMPIGVAPLTVTASKGADFDPVTASNVLLGATPTTQNFDLRRMEPCVSTNPASYEVTIVRGGTLNSPLALFNNGALGTDYEITEVNGGYIPLRPGILLRPAAPTSAFAKTAPAQVGLTAPSFIPLGADLITEGFEGAAFPPTGWTSVVNNPSFTWMLEDYSPHSGTQYADIVYDPSLAQQDEWLLSPELNLTSGVLSLWSFGSLDWCKVTNDNCDLNVWLVVGDVGGGDDILVGVADDAWTANWTWAQSTWNLDALMPGGPVRIGLQYYGMDGAEVGLDDVLLNGETGGGPGGDVPWLSVSPITGTLASDGSQNATVLFDTTVLTQTGTYNAILNLNTDDAQTPWAIPVTMHVILPTYAVSLDADPLIQVGDRGAWVTHQVTVTNDGDDPYGDLFSFSVSGNGWITNVPAPVLVMPGESAVVDVDVFIPAGAMPGSVDNVTVEAESASNPAVFAEIALTTVARSFVPVMTPPTLALTGAPDTQVSYTLHLVNAGTYTDSYLLTISGNGWTTNLSTPVVTLAPGESIDIVVTVNIPAGALLGSQDVVTITARSLLDLTKAVQSILTTTADYRYMYLPLITR